MSYAKFCRSTVLVKGITKQWFLQRPTFAYIIESAFHKRPPFTVATAKPLIFGGSFYRFGTMSDSENKKAELKKRLTPLEYHVTQEKGTER